MYCTVRLGTALSGQTQHCQARHSTVRLGTALSDHVQHCQTMHSTVRLGTTLPDYVQHCHTMCIRPRIAQTRYSTVRHCHIPFIHSLRHASFTFSIVRLGTSLSLVSDQVRYCQSRHNIVRHCTSLSDQVQHCPIRYNTVTVSISGMSPLHTSLSVSDMPPLHSLIQCCQTRYSTARPGLVRYSTVPVTVLVLQHMLPLYYIVLSDQIQHCQTRYVLSDKVQQTIHITVRLGTALSDLVWHHQNSYSTLYSPVILGTALSDWLQLCQTGYSTVRLGTALPLVSDQVHQCHIRHNAVTSVRRGTSVSDQVLHCQTRSSLHIQHCQCPFYTKQCQIMSFLYTSVRL